MTTFHRILMRLAAVWFGVLALVFMIAVITNGKELNSGHFIVYGMFTVPGLLALALAWVVKPPA